MQNVKPRTTNHTVVSPDSDARVAPAAPAGAHHVWSPITGEKAPDTVNDGKGPDSMTAKPDIIKYLKDSFAFGHKAVATLNASNLVEPISSSSGRPTTRLFLATFAAAHAFDHYGQLIEYLRMNGIIPPASRGQ